MSLAREQAETIKAKTRELQHMETQLDVAKAQALKNTETIKE